MALDHTGLQRTWIHHQISPCSLHGLLQVRPHAGFGTRVGPVFDHSFADHKCTMHFATPKSRPAQLNLYLKTSHLTSHPRTTFHPGHKSNKKQNNSSTPTLFSLRVGPKHPNSSGESALPRFDPQLLHLTNN